MQLFSSLRLCVSVLRALIGFSPAIVAAPLLIGLSIIVPAAGSGAESGPVASGPIEVREPTGRPTFRKIRNVRRTAKFGLHISRRYSVVPKGIRALPEHGWSEP